MKRVLLALVLIVATGLIGWRVLRPIDLLSTGPIPAGVPTPIGVTGRSALPPLLVGGRLRVYAGKGQVRADGPISLPAMSTPSWSYRRWPQQVSGVVASGTTVVSRWSDGLLVAIDGLTGRIRWRASTPAGDGFTDSRTVVWSPPGLFASADSVFFSSGGALTGFSAADGSVRCTGPVCGNPPLRPAGNFGPVHDLTTDNVLVLPSGEGIPLKTDKESSLDWKPGGWQLSDGYLAVERLKADGTPFSVERVVIVFLGS